MGLGPFRFVGIVSIPSSSVAEANPDAYNNALRDLPNDLIGGCGTCSCCGQSIMHVCIIRNAAGERYGVGTDCVLKTGNAYLGDEAKVAIAKHQRHLRWQQREAKRQAEHKVWLAQVCETGETNAARLERVRLEKEAAEKRVQAERKAQQATNFNRYAFLLPILSAQSRTEGDFCYNMAARIRNGNELSGRPLEIVGEIYARQYGRRGSKGYEQAMDEFCKAVDGEEVRE